VYHYITQSFIKPAWNKFRIIGEIALEGTLETPILQSPAQSRANTEVRWRCSAGFWKFL